jgi:Leucine-rich repeat (LRR) protein
MALPPKIARLTALHLLDLTENRLTTLPPEIARLTALKTLQLERNPLSDRYLSLIEGGQPTATVNVLASLRTELDQSMLARAIRLFRRFLDWS